MPDQLQLRGGTTAQHASFTGVSKEVTIDTTKKTAVVHDGTTAGGNPLLREDGSNSALALGSAGTPSLKFTGDTNTGIYSPGADQVSFATGGAERLRIDTTGQIEAVSLGTAAAPTYTFTGDPDTGVYSPGANQLAISTGGSGRLFVDASGNVGIGGAPVANFEVTSPQPSFRLSDTNGTVDNNKYQIYINSSQDLQFQALSDAGVGGGSVWKFTRNASQIENFIGTRSGVDRIALSNWDNKITFSNALGVLGTATAHDLQITTNNTERARIDSSGRWLLGTSSSGSPSLLTVQGNTAPGIIGNLGSLDIAFNGTPASGNTVGQLRFTDQGLAGNAYAQISCVADAVTGTNDYPGRLVFSTTADGASSPTERMRISSGGVILFNQKTVAPDASNGGFALSPSTNERMLASVGSTSTAAQNLFLFYNPNGLVGTITTNGSATAYNTSSDYRLKENVIAVTDGITRLQQLKPSRFNFIADPTKTVDGFIAHEVQTVVPEAITGKKDAVDDEGNPQYQGIDQSKLVPLLTAALQEAVAKIESLEARLTAAGI